MGAVLVTGAAGFIGSHLVERLLAAGERVVGLDNYDDGYGPARKERNLATARETAAFAEARGDVRDRELVSSLLRDHAVDRIVHLAARTSPSASVEHPEPHVESNVGGTLALLQSAVEAGVGALVYGSSAAVYGLTGHLPFREDEPLGRPTSPYGATKLAGEALCHAYHYLHGLAVTCLRLSTTYGPRQRPDMAVHSFVRRILSKQEVVLAGDGSQARDHTFVSDIVSGITAALERCDGYHVYNLGSQTAVPLRRVLRLLEELCEARARIVRGPESPGGPPVVTVSVEKALQELGYRPTVGLEDGLAAFVDWYRGQAPR